LLTENNWIFFHRNRGKKRCEGREAILDSRSGKYEGTTAQNEMHKRYKNIPKSKWRQASEQE